jgi:deoxyribodipyrimidine photolyase-like uncharacterized protein
MGWARYVVHVERINMEEMYRDMTARNHLREAGPVVSFFWHGNKTKIPQYVGHLN